MKTLLRNASVITCCLMLGLTACKKDKDIDGRIKTYTYNGVEESYTYDDLDRLISVSRSNGYEWEISYEGSNVIFSGDWIDTISVNSQGLAYKDNHGFNLTWNSQNQQLSATNSSNTGGTYTWNNAGNIESFLCQGNTCASAFHYTDRVDYRNEPYFFWEGVRSVNLVDYIVGNDGGNSYTTYNTYEFDDNGRVITVSRSNSSLKERFTYFD